MQLELRSSEPAVRGISPFLEMGAYEHLWSQLGATFKTIAEKFRTNPDALPSDLVARGAALEKSEWVRARFAENGVRRFGVRVHRAGEYPAKLRDARHPIELLYFRGLWNFVESPSVAVVGTRDPSRDGVVRARKITELLSAAGYTIVSGLARGIDTVAHTTALERHTPTIAVLGTPIDTVYPPENAELQARIAREFLVVSQVPAYRYAQQKAPQNRLFFPERNVTMSALTLATVIVEAGETSGTLVQGRAALQQGRQLFILNSAFERNDLTWPKRFEEQGAVRIRHAEELIERLKSNG